MNTIIIKTDRDKRFCQSMIDESPLDGSKTVIFRGTSASPTDRQRRLQWLWYTEIASSGLGRDDHKDGVHLTAKWIFARPILLRDDEVFAVVYQAFMEMVKDSVNFSRYCREFTKQHISTERMTRKQRAEYLTELQRYWIGKGVELTDPALQGVDLREFEVAI